jgi:small redox-active disulfide protein 2
MLIEICGAGCARCEATAKNVFQALRALGIGPDVQFVTIIDIQRIRAMGVIITPAVFIDGRKVCENRVPSPEEIKKLLKLKNISCN